MNVLGVVLTAAGGLALVGGLVWHFLEPSGTSSSIGHAQRTEQAAEHAAAFAVAPAFGPGYGGIGFAMTF